jgi:hypothetical protein
MNHWLFFPPAFCNFSRRARLASFKEEKQQPSDFNDDNFSITAN